MSYPARWSPTLLLAFLCLSGCGSPQYNEIPYRLETRDGIVTLTIANLTIEFEGLAKPYDKDNEVYAENKILIRAPFHKETHDTHMSRFGDGFDLDFECFFEDGVGTIKLNNFEAKITNGGKTLEIGEEKFDLIGEKRTIVIGKDGKPSRKASSAQTPALTRHEMTALVRKQLPFLKEKATFWDEYPGNNPGHGEPHKLVADLDAKRFEIRTSKDLTPLIEKIDSEEDALKLVRFLSDPEGGLDHPIEPLTDIPFTEIRQRVRSLTISRKVLAQYKITEPIVTRDGNGFLVTRFVLPVHEMKRVWKLGGGTHKLKMIAHVKERVSRTGDYSYEFEEIPVENFEVHYGPIGLD